MKINITEVHFIQQDVNSVSIKASDAPFVSTLVAKIDKEFDRLQKAEEKKPETKVDLEAVKA